MRSSIVIKGNKYGFQIVLNPVLSFEDLLKEVALKFTESKGFFDQDRPVAISFQGRNLSDEEQNLLVDTIADNSGLRIAYIIDGAKAVETEFARVMENLPQKQAAAPAISSMEEVEAVQEEEEPVKPVPAETSDESDQKTEKNGQFYRGTLRSGQKIEVDGSIVILGDINPGAHVIAGGNVVVLGCLKGTVTAGYPDDKSAFVVSMMMDPMQIKIGQLIARSPDQKTVKLKKKGHKKQPELEAKIAFVEDDNIFIETLTRSLISEFSTIQP